MNRKEIFVLLTSTILLIDGIDNIAENIILFLLSLSLVRKPSLLLPLIWVSSWYSELTVLPYLGAYFYYSIFFVILILTRYFSLQGHSRNNLVYIVLFLLWIVITGVTALDPEIDNIVKTCVYILILSFASCTCIKDFRGIQNGVILVSVCASVFFSMRILFFPIQFVVDSVHDWGVSTLTGTTILPGLNPNTAAQIVVLISVVLLCELIKNRKFLFLVPLLMNAYTLITLGSRTSFFTLVIVFMLYYGLFSRISLGKKAGYAFVVLLCYVIFTAIWNDTISSSRIVNESIFEDEGSGRFVNWVAMFSIIYPHYWLTGVGMGRNSLSSLGFPYDADNLYVDLLCQIGVVGFVLFLMIIMRYIRQSYRIRLGDSSYPDFLFMMMVAFLFFGIGETVFGSPMYWATMVLVAVCNNSDYKISY